LVSQLITSTLDVPFTEQEVWETILNLHFDKALGPDGFIGRFYKACWNIIKVEVLNAISAVWSRNFINLDRVNSAYIAMVPKIDGADQVKDFRPISLVHNFAKLVTKILANRLASKLNDLVSPNQSAFIKGRFIQDNFMLVQQTSRFLHQQNRACLLFKLDITKAFCIIKGRSLDVGSAQSRPCAGTTTATTGGSARIRDWRRDGRWMGRGGRRIRRTVRDDRSTGRGRWWIRRTADAQGREVDGAAEGGSGGRRMRRDDGSATKRRPAGRDSGREKDPRPRRRAGVGGPRQQPEKGKELAARAAQRRRDGAKKLDQGLV
jgi:hypothetical protein